MATTFSADRNVRVHPVHGILAAFPLAFFTAAFATDLAYANTAQMQWANFSVWLIAGGLFMGVLAGLAGIVDVFANRRRDNRRPWPHSIGVGLMMFFALINVFVHSRDAWTSVVPTGLILSAITAILALATSWMGYSLEARQETR